MKGQLERLAGRRDRLAAADRHRLAEGAFHDAALRLADWRQKASRSSFRFGCSLRPAKPLSDGPIAYSGQRGERCLDVLGRELQHNVNVARKPQIPMRIDGKAAGHEVANACGFQSMNERIEASELHAAILPRSLATRPCLPEDGGRTSARAK